MTSDLDAIINACTRNGTVPAPPGTWDALAALTGLKKHNIRSRSYKLRSERGLRVRKPAEGTPRRQVEVLKAPETKRSRFAFWRKVWPHH